MFLFNFRYHQVLAEVPNDPSVLIEMAHMYEESGDIIMAQQCYMDVSKIKIWLAKTDIYSEIIFAG